MKHHNKKRRWVVSAVMLAVCFSLMAAMTMAQAFAVEKTYKCAEPSQAQQMCPPKTPAGTCEIGSCKVAIDCPPIKTPGQTTCQATIDCPAKPAQPEKEQQNK
jgi:hypothetical protein